MLRFGIRYTFECSGFRRLYRLKLRFQTTLRQRELQPLPCSHGYFQALNTGESDYPARPLRRGFWCCDLLAKVRFLGWFRRLQPLFSPRCVLMNFTGGAVQRDILQVRIAGQRLKYFLKKVIFAPQTESGIHGFPRTKTLRQVTPRSTCFDFPKHSIQHHPIELRRSAFSCVFGWQ